jgi:DNA-directed RNA polymerase subunit E'/Rpb7
MCDYVRTVMIKDIVIEPHKIDKKIDEVITFNLKRSIEGKCLDKGFVREGSVELIKRSMGFFSGSLFNASVKFRVSYSCDLCNPSKGDKIKCNVGNINESGILADLGPLKIIVPKQLQNDKTIFKNLNQGDEIEIIIVEKKYEINSKYITVAAIIDEDKLFEKKLNIEIVKEKMDSKKLDMKFKLSSIDNINNDIDINSLANELELSDSDETDEFYGSDEAEVKTENMIEEGNIKSYEEITGNNNINLQTVNINVPLENPDEQEIKAKEESNIEIEKEESGDSDNDSDSIEHDEETDEETDEEIDDSGDDDSDDDSGDDSDDDKSENSDDKSVDNNDSVGTNIYNKNKKNKIDYSDSENSSDDETNIDY